MLEHQEVAEELSQHKENVVAGIAGAFLFSLVGGVLWYFLFRVGIWAGVSGIAGVLAAVRGYTCFAKKQSLMGIAISIITAVLVLVAAWYLCLATDVYHVYKFWHQTGKIDYEISFGQAISIAHTYFSDQDIAFAYLKYLGIGVAFCFFAGFLTVAKHLKSMGQSFVQDSHTP